LASAPNEGVELARSAQLGALKLTIHIPNDSLMINLLTSKSNHCHNHPLKSAQSFEVETSMYSSPFFHAMRQHFHSLIAAQL
jgi:hypothetical protein